MPTAEQINMSDDTEPIKPKSLKEKKKALNSILGKLKKSSKRDLNIGFGEVEEYTFIKTPFPTVNTLMGGGIPKGKFGVIAGPSMTAKSALLMQIIAYNQDLDPDFVALWSDAEESLDEAWAIRLGVDLDRLIVHRYDESVDYAYAEELLEQGLQLMEAHAIDMWVIDSIGALLPKAEVVKTLTENQMLDIQRKLGVFFRRGITSIAPKKGENWKGTAVAMIGQVYTVPSASVKLEEVRGGNSVKHWAHWRLKTRRGNRDEGPGTEKVTLPDGEVKDIARGWAQHVKLDKTKQNDKEGQEVILQFMHGRGLDSEMCAITALFAHDTFAKGGGGWYTHENFPGDNRIRGKESVIEFLKENKEICKDLIQELDNQLIADTQQK
jgi:recombination protein RecA